MGLLVYLFAGVFLGQAVYGSIAGNVTQFELAATSLLSLLVVVVASKRDVKDVMPELVGEFGRRHNASYEHAIIEMEVTELTMPVPAELDRMQDEGWEVVSVMDGQNPRYKRFLIRRPETSPKPLKNNGAKA